MKNGYTHWGIIIDRSGSMKAIAPSIIEGFNKLVEDQKSEPGELTVSLVQFDSYYDEEASSPFSHRWGSETLKYNQINDFAPLDKVNLLSHDNFHPRGGTPLNDAVARFIEETGTRLAAMPEAFRPEKVIVTIITDGEENTSKKHTRDSVRRMIEKQEKDYNWKFIYIGANQDSFQEGNSRGISSTLNFTADAKGTTAAYFSNSVSMKKMRSMSKSDFVGYSATTDMLNTYNDELKKDQSSFDEKPEDKTTK